MLHKQWEAILFCPNNVFCQKLKCLFIKECMLDFKYEIKVNINCEIMQKVSKKANSY